MAAIAGSRGSIQAERRARGSARAGRRAIGRGWVIATYAALAFFLLWTVVPFIWMMLASIKTNKEIYQDFTILPKSVYFGHYVALLSGKFGIWMRNSALAPLHPALPDRRQAGDVGYPRCPHTRLPHLHTAILHLDAHELLPEHPARAGGGRPDRWLRPSGRTRSHRAAAFGARDRGRLPLLVHPGLERVPVRAGLHELAGYPHSNGRFDANAGRG